MANMIKFYRGLVNTLPATGENGALYITTDEGAIYYGTGTGMKRLGDFVQVDNVAALPAKAHESCLYYCVAENILAKWNGTEWKQINKQPTAEELKTLLGLGSMAYVSTVVEDNLSTELKEKINAASEGNHSHSNKGVLDGITAEKVAAWDGAEGNAKTYADGLNTAMDTRVKAVEGTSHSHTNKALLDAYTQTEENLADAVAKKHEHTNKTELDKIASGDKAKWDAVVADHLTSADKTALEDAIGDVNTALGEEVNRAKAAEKANSDAIADIKDGTSIDSFADVETELGKKVDKVEGKSLIADAEIARLANVTNYDDTQVKADIAKKADAETMTTELGKKVDKVEGKSLISDAEITRLAGVTNYDDTQVKADIAKKADSDTMATELDKKVDKVEGKSLVSDTEIARLANVENYNDAEVRGLIGDNAEAIEDLETYVGTIPETATATNIVAYVQEKTAGIATDTALEELTGRVAGLETESAKHAVKTEVEGALALKADKSVVDAMYTNTKIDELIAEAKKHADDNDADTKYGIVYDSDNKKIKLVEGGSEVEIDASAFIKDGMINTVTINENDDLVITFNTDAGKEDIVLPLDQLVDIYTGVEGARIKVTVGEDKSISADLVANSIGKDFLDADVKASLALADSAIQSHQDISHLATKAELQGVDDKFANYTNTTDMNAALALKADKTQVATDIATAMGEALSEAATTAQGKVDALANGQVKANTDAIATKANSDDVYAKTETYSQDEVDALLTWGSF